jgi:hypothetical protein
LIRTATARVLTWSSRIAVAASVVLLGVALLWPLRFEHAMHWALAGLLAAFISSLWRFYALRAPLQGRYGVVTIDGQPIAYRLSIAAGTAMGMFLLYVVLREVL